MAVTGESVLDNPTNIDELRLFFMKTAGQGITPVTQEGDVLAVFNPSYVITKDGSGRAIQIDVTYEGQTARKLITYPTSVTTAISPWAMV